MNFEWFMIKGLGGNNIFSSLMGKKINIHDQDQMVYDYILTTEKFDAPRPQFLQVDGK